jgi:hypothetical protein
MRDRKLINCVIVASVCILNKADEDVFVDGWQLSKAVVCFLEVGVVDKLVEDGRLVRNNG